MPLSIPTLLSLCILLSIPTLPLFLLFRLIPTILRFFIRDMPTYQVRQMLVLHRRTEDLLAFLPGTEVQTLQPVMNSAGHQFRVEFPIRIPGHVDIQSTPRIRQSEITDTPTQWFLLVRLMPRHQKKQPPIHTDSHPDSTADAPSKLVKKRRACWRRWGRHSACPPVVVLICSTAGRSGMRWASRPTSACLN